MTSAAAVLLAATALHAGFQLTVSVLVYPTLARTPAADWPAVHDRHSRAITPLVGVVYVLLAVACGWVLVADRRLWTLLAVAAVVGTVAVTAVAAAPLHGRLEQRDDALVRRLLVADRARAVLAVGAAACALLGVLR